MTTLKFSEKFPPQIHSDAVAILVKKNYELTDSGEKIDQSLNGLVLRTLREQSFLVKKGNTLTCYTNQTNPKKVIVVAFEDTQDRRTALREAAYAAAKAAEKRGIGRLAMAFDQMSDLQAMGEGALLAGYKFRKYKSEKDPGSRLKEITICGQGDGKAAMQRAAIFSQATMYVRDLVNEPANELNPLKLEEAAKAIAKEFSLELKIFEPEELARMGAFSFLSVGKGSVVPCRMLHLTYEPKTTAQTHVAIVGKGLTFDSGGLSLKSEKGMEHMKSDMSGAATVLACMRAVARLRLPIKLSGVLMATENMPDGGANRPGDVVTAMNGKTIEITNTDAEGRLALADGLSYIQESNPDYLIDLATLTGAQGVALGRLMGAVLSNDETLTRRIVDAGEKSGEKMWPLPLYEPYRDLIRSDIADVKNSSGLTEAGTIQGGLFLSEFVHHPRWAHLDIAGPAWQDREWSVHARMASGFGARCLLTFLTDLRD